MSQISFRNAACVTFCINKRKLGISTEVTIIVLKNIDEARSGMEIIETVKTAF